MLDTRNAPVNVYLSAGSNIAAERNLKMACRELESEYGELTLSSVYQNPAVGFEGDDFLNMVIGFSTCDKPEVIVDRLEGLHDKAQRKRQSDPFSPRTLDVDLLLYGDLVSGSDPTLPREDIEKYSFVLAPMAEVAPELRHPVLGMTMHQIWGDFDRHAHPMQKVEIGIA